MDWKPAGLAVNGFIALTLAGAAESTARFGSRSLNAAKNQNSVMFTKKQQPEFEKLRAALEQAIAGRYDGPAAVAPDVVAQLAQLAAMHDAGSLTDEEFAEMKARLVEGGA